MILKCSKEITSNQFRCSKAEASLERERQYNNNIKILDRRSIGKNLIEVKISNYYLYQ